MYQTPLQIAKRRIGGDAEAMQNRGVQILRDHATIARIRPDAVAGPDDLPAANAAAGQAH